MTNQTKPGVRKNGPDQHRAQSSSNFVSEFISTVVNWIANFFVRNFFPHATAGQRRFIFLAIGALLVSAYWWVPPVAGFVKEMVREINFPVATGDRLSILVAELSDDEDGRLTDRVEQALQTQFEDTVEILRPGELLAMASNGSLQEREKDVSARGQRLLARARADLLIWGIARHKDKIIDLHIIPREDAYHPSQAYLLDPALKLGEDFNRDLDVVFTARVVSAFEQNDGNAARFLGPLQRMVSQRLGAVLSGLPALPLKASKAAILHSYGLLMTALGSQSQDKAVLASAVKAFREELKLQPAKKPRAVTQYALGIALRTLGELLHSDAMLEEAIGAYREALRVFSYQSDPGSWAMLQNTLCGALTVRAELNHDEKTARQLLEEALEYCKASLNEFRGEPDSIHWAAAQDTLGTTLRALGELTHDPKRLQESIEAHEAALAVVKQHDVKGYIDTVQRNLERARAALRKTVSPSQP